MSENHLILFAEEFLLEEFREFLHFWGPLICFLSSTSNELRCHPCHSERCRAVSPWENELSNLHVLAASLRCLGVSAYETTQDQGLTKVSHVRWHWFPENRRTSRPLWRVLFALAGFLRALGNSTGWVKVTCTKNCPCNLYHVWSSRCHVFCARCFSRFPGWPRSVPTWHARLPNFWPYTNVSMPDWWWSLGKRATSSGQWGNPTEMASLILRFWPHQHDPVEQTINQ